MQIPLKIRHPEKKRTIQMGFKATTVIDRLDYNLKWNQLMEAGGAIVGSDVKITVDLEVTKK